MQPVAYTHSPYTTTVCAAHRRPADDTSVYRSDIGAGHVGNHCEVHDGPILPPAEYDAERRAYAEWEERYADVL